ncbi:hsh2d [Pungitius sinensis]
MSRVPGHMESGRTAQWGRPDAVAWFTGSQLPLVIRNGVVPEWFHGIISRKEAEDLLMSKPAGYFLIRVGESRIGYSLSYRAEDRCRHFMIDASQDGRYNIVGESRHHRCLQDMVDFHRRTPVRPFSEVLTVPSGQVTEKKTDYAELIFPLKSPNHDNSLFSSVCRPSPREEIPPALSSETHDTTVWLPDRLYPKLEEEVQRDAIPLPAKPVTGMRCTADDPPPRQPPPLPARTSLPPANRDPAPARNPLGGDAPPAKNQEARASVVSNLKNLKKKFLKKKSPSQECAEVTERGGPAGNEYECIAEPQTFGALRVTDGELPYEYLPPPPFAPGF